ncbi:hypothetical protein Gotur_025497 [Gossypium turneri]
MDSSTVRIISGCFVKPQHVSEQSKQPFYLTWDLVMLSVHYIQKGILYTKPPPPGDYCEQNLINNVLEPNLYMQLVGVRYKEQTSSACGLSSKARCLLKKQ